MKVLYCSFAVVMGHAGWMAIVSRLERRGKSAKSVDYRWKSPSPAEVGSITQICIFTVRPVLR
jgi:hypothetical protein